MTFFIFLRGFLIFLIIKDQIYFLKIKKIIKNNKKLNLNFFFVNLKYN